MKKILILLLLFFIPSNAFAVAPVYDDAYYYINQVTPNAALGNEDKYRTKEGRSESISVLGLVTLGDAGIRKACQDGGIKKINSIETKTEGVWILYRKFVTIVRGK